MLNRSGERRHTCLVPDREEKAFSLQITTLHCLMSSVFKLLFHGFCLVFGLFQAGRQSWSPYYILATFWILWARQKEAHSQSFPAPPTCRFVLPHSSRIRGPTVALSFYRLGDWGNVSSLLASTAGSGGNGWDGGPQNSPLSLLSAVGKSWTWESVQENTLTCPASPPPLHSRLRLVSHLRSALRLTEHFA